MWRGSSSRRPSPPGHWAAYSYEEWNDRAKMPIAALKRQHNLLEKHILIECARDHYQGVRVVTFNLVIESQGDNALTAGAALALAGRAAFDGGAILKPFSSAVVEFNGATDLTISASCKLQIGKDLYSNAATARLAWRL